MLARLHKRTQQFIVLTAALFLTAPVLGKDTLSLNFGVFSTENATSVVRRYMPTLQALERSMSVKLNRTVDIRMHIATERNQATLYLSAGDVDFASLSPDSYIASKASEAEVRILAAKNSKDSITLTPWVARAGMRDSVFMALKESMLELQSSKVLTSLNTIEFVQSHDSQYAHLIKQTDEVAALESLPNKNTVLQTEAIQPRVTEPALLAAKRAGVPIDILDQEISKDQKIRNEKNIYNVKKQTVPLTEE